MLEKISFEINRSAPYNQGEKKTLTFGWFFGFYFYEPVYEDSKFQSF